MKTTNQVIRWGSLTALAGLVCTLVLGNAQAGDTKRYKETGQEYVVTHLTAGVGALPQPIFAEARSRYGDEVWAGVIHASFVNNVGGKGTGISFEAVHYCPGAPKQQIIYVIAYKTMENGDRLVMEGWAIPQLDGTLQAEGWLVPELGTGKFAGATGFFTELRPIPGGYVMEGTMSTVGATKK